MKAYLFIDRDGTIIREPEDEQIDSLEKLSFLPRVMHALTQLDGYEYVMVTNQDGLGTDSFPEDTFWPAHNKMMEALEGEGIIFSEVCIDRSFPHENSPNRKPQTGLLTRIMADGFDRDNSYVIGDRLSDIELAKNLGCRGILINDGSLPLQDLADSCALVTESWDDILAFLTLPTRSAHVVRKTSETDIEIELNVDGSGNSEISTGLPFFDHMLEQIARHGNMDLRIKVAGDLHIDEHHTIEDTALALGSAFAEALTDKRGMYRYGFLLPMDDCLAQVAIDFGGRPWCVWEAEFSREKIGDMPTEMFFHFFKSFSDNARCNLNIKAEGDNEHHKIEAIFKAFARAIRMAVTRDVANMTLPSTKGTL